MSGLSVRYTRTREHHDHYEITGPRGAVVLLPDVFVANRYGRLGNAPESVVAKLRGVLADKFDTEAQGGILPETQVISALSPYSSL